MRRSTLWFSAHVSVSGATIRGGDTARSAAPGQIAERAWDGLAAAVVDRLGEAIPRISRWPDEQQAAALACRFVLDTAVDAGRSFALDMGTLSTVVSIPGGSMHEDREYWETARIAGGATASPAIFAMTLPSAFGGELARAMGLRGSMLVIGQGLSDDMPHLFGPAQDAWLLVRVGPDGPHGGGLAAALLGRGPLVTAPLSAGARTATEASGS